MERLRELLTGRILLLCHHNADPDAVGSAFGVQRLIESLDPTADAEIFLPGGASRLTRKIMEALGIEALGEASIDDYDALVILDTASLNQLEDWGERVSESNAKKIFIDHHSVHPSMVEIADYTLIDESATSTCELVYQIYSSLGITPTPAVARALLIGIAYDSKHFAIATPTTLNAASALLEIDGPLEDVLSMLRTERKRPERIARLKTAQRMQLHDLESWTLATSQLSSFQASGARALIGLGADVSIVCGSEKGKLRASLRASDRFFQGTSIHLGEVARALGEEFGGAGSGHPTAAGVNGEGDAELFLERAVLMFSEMVERAS
ncbi:MAG: DHH family phosphoesterase [Candidatus Bathyarchaeia archaeon]